MYGFLPRKTPFEAKAIHSGGRRKIGPGACSKNQKAPSAYFVNFLDSALGKLRKALCHPRVHKNAIRHSLPARFRRPRISE